MAISQMLRGERGSLNPLSVLTTPALGLRGGCWRGQQSAKGLGEEVGTEDQAALLVVTGGEGKGAGKVTTLK